MDRRSLLFAAGALSAAVTAPGAASAAKAEPSLTGPYIDLTSGKGAALNRARIHGNLDETKEKFGNGSGIVSAVVPGQKIRPLMGFEIFSVGRLEAQPDGAFRFLHREVVYYTDLKTGEILTEYMNPFSNELVKVVHVINDPWNELIEEFEPRPPSYGGLIQDNSPRKPYHVPHTLLPGGVVSSYVSVDLYYPATLKPEQWPRESAGPMNQVTEQFTTFMSLADVQNPKKTSVEANGVWVRMTPWLPWLLMGQAPGLVQYNATFSTYDDINRTDRKVLDFTETHYPQMMKAPSDWNAKSLSSLENYAATQSPQPRHK